MATYLVTGASGQLGRLVIAQLAELVPLDSIIALVRTEKARAAYAAEGITARLADYENPANLRAALAGVDRMLLISSSEVGRRAPQHANVIAAAREAGVGFIAYTSILNAETGGMALAEEHLATEDALRDSGLPFAILRNGWYSENITGTAAQALSIGQHFGAAGAGRFATASRADYAEAAARVLAGKGHEGKTYELGGDEGFTLAEYASILSELAGRRIAYVDMPEAAYRDALVGAGLPAAFAAVLADSDAKAAKGALATNSHDLSRLIGHPTTPIRKTLQAVLG
ncbi:SDR family oxidoreductase [Seohaeicola zhoushanensis]|uniref:NAD(P)-dependent oxidoreductase n=1 Tax=Seohaeicola zhoushanensis TaxID=1569283 RepID=A0A8J3M5L9_9RHOB|nr:SDR family oxidoreductase [Seohaeicola zhoushanensis]GHF39932.1 NAD(P)-dependent oxidoreductase [Seohaeicola zhoushanensis]